MGGKSSQSTQQITIPPEVMARYNSVNARAQEVAGTPFQQYSTDPNAFVAPLTATQQAGIAGTNYYANAAQPYFQRAAEMTQYGSQAVNPTDLNAEAIQKYMSPYLNNVLQGTAGMLNQQNQQAMAGQTGNAIRSGAFGGDRSGIAAANLAQQQRLADANIFSGILNQGYGQALSTAGQQQQLGLMASQANREALQRMAGQYSALGSGAQAAGLQGAQAQLAAGQMEQQTNQAGLGALYNQFLQEKSYPFQVAQFLANIAMGTGALSGSTTTTNQAMGGFSDRRLKENVKPVGKTFDGQTIYSYNFKGDPKTEIGLIAQEVEKHHPEAVGLAGGYKTVRYDKATEDAADRGKFAQGGASMGGGVMPFHAGEGFDNGGFVGFDPALMQQIMASYQQMYAPFMPGQAGRGGPGSGGLGAASYVPQASVPVGQLQTAGELPQMQNPMETVNQMISMGDAIGKIGASANLWDYGAPQTEEQKRRQDIKNVVKGYRRDNEETPPPPVSSKTASTPSYPNQDEPLTPEQVAALGRSHGGRTGYATGGLMPYTNPNQSGKLDIPDQPQKTPELLTAKPAEPLQDKTFETMLGLANLGVGIAGLSDKRLKENIKPIGKTFDGQTVYSYNFKGDPKTEIGLIAQEVEKHHPNAVGSANGYKTVHYGKATADAAHMAKGLGRSAHAAGGTPYSSYNPDNSLVSGDKTMSSDISIPMPMGIRRGGSRADNAVALGLLGLNALQMLRGGRDRRISYAGGGAPYAQIGSGMGLSIPTEQSNAPELKTADDPSKLEDKTFSTGLGLANLGVNAAKVFGGKAYGGVAGYADGGLIGQQGVMEPEGEVEEEFDPTDLYHGENRFLDNLFKSVSSDNKNIDLLTGEAATAPSEVAKAPAAEKPAFSTLLSGLGAAEKGREEESSPSTQIGKREEPSTPSGLAATTQNLPKDLGYIARLVRSAEGDGAATTSTALGRYGITKGTYRTYFQKAFPEEARRLGPGGIDALRLTPRGRAINDQLGPMIIADNAAILKRNGFDTNARNVYLAHFLGPQGALDVLRAPLNAPVERVVRKNAIDANLAIFGNGRKQRNVRTVGQLLDFIGGRMSQMDAYHRKNGRGLNAGGRVGYQNGGDTKDKLISDSVSLADAGSSDMSPEEQAAYKAYIASHPSGDDPALQGLAAAGDNAATVTKVETTDTGLTGGTPQQQTATEGDQTQAQENSELEDAYNTLLSDSISDDNTGLAAAQPAQKGRGFFGNIAKGKFISGLGQGKADSWIPLLTGLATYGTIPTRSPLSGILAGVGAGAQTAQKMREYGLKKGELEVAQKLADAKVMEITKGILSDRYIFMEGGAVYDTRYNVYLNAEDATIAWREAFNKGPYSALSEVSPKAVPREEWEKTHPPSGTLSQEMTFTPSYMAEKNNPTSVFYASAEMTPGAQKAKIAMDTAWANMMDLNSRMGDPSSSDPRRFAQLNAQLQVATVAYDRAKDKYREIIGNLVKTPIALYEAGQQGILALNLEQAGEALRKGQDAQLLLPVFDAARKAITQGGPLSNFKSTLGLGLIQLGLDANLVNVAFGGDPAAAPTQNAIATLIESLGGKGAAAATANNPAAAVNKFLDLAEQRARAEFGRAQQVNETFRQSGGFGDVFKSGSKATTAGQTPVQIYVSHPRPGALPKGTPYKVKGDPNTHYAK